MSESLNGTHCHPDATSQVYSASLHTEDTLTLEAEVLVHKP